MKKLFLFQLISVVLYLVIFGRELLIGFFLMGAPYKYIPLILLNLNIQVLPFSIFMFLLYYFISSKYSLKVTKK